MNGSILSPTANSTPARYGAYGQSVREHGVHGREGVPRVEDGTQYMGGLGQYMGTWTSIWEVWASIWVIRLVY